MNENQNNPVNPVEDLDEVRKTRGLSKLFGFTERMFQHLNAWLDEQVAYRKISEYCLSEWQREVPHSGTSKMLLELTLVDNRTGHVLWHARQQFRANPAKQADVVEAMLRMLRAMPARS